MFKPGRRIQGDSPPLGPVKFMVFREFSGPNGFLTPNPLERQNILSPPTLDEFLNTLLFLSRTPSLNYKRLMLCGFPCNVNKQKISEEN